MKYYCLLFFLLLLTGMSHAQVILTPLASPETIVACGPEEQFTLSVINSDNTGYGNLILELQLPQGMEYVSGSIIGPIEEFDLSDSSNPFFRFPGLPALSSFELTFATIINCSFNNDAGIFYQMMVNGDNVTAQEQPLANFFFPEVVITEVDFPVLNMAVGSNQERIFTIIQSTPGASLDSVFLVNTYEPGMSTLGLNLGSLFGSGPGVDTFLITGADLPGNDGFFNHGDTLRLTETVRLDDCVSANSAISLFWRCGEVICQEFNLNTLLSQATGSPDLRILNTNGFPNQTTANNPSLVGGGFCDTLELTYRLENLGSEDAPGAGAVYDLVIGLGLNNNLFSSSEPFDLAIFPNWEIFVSIDGTIINLGTYQYPTPNPLLGYNLDFSVLSTDPDGPGGLTDLDQDGFFDDLPVDSETEISVHIVYDPYVTDDCAFLSGYPYNGGAETNFRLGYEYRDQCMDYRSYWYSVNDPGINVVSLFTHRNITYTIELEENNLNQGQVTTMEIRPDGAWNSPCGATDSIVLEIILPDGLVAEPNAYGPGSFDGIVGMSGDTVWLSSNERGTFTQPWGLSVSLDCSEIIQDTTVDVSFLYYCSPDCGPPKRIDCQEIIIDYLPQCEPCLEGIETRGFAAERISLGWTNSAHTQQVDPSIDPTINLGAAIDKDSVALKISGILRGNGPYDGLNARITHQGLNPSFADPTLPHFSAIGAQLEYFTVNGDNYLCEDLNPDISWSYNSSENEHLILAHLESYFESGGCLELLNRSSGDSLVFTIFTIITDNTPRRALPLPDLTAQFFLLQNGNEISCNSYLDNFVLEQVVPNANLAYATQEHYGCQEIYFNNNSITNPGHIYDADQFPNEVRSIVDVNEVRMILEGDWHHQAGSSDLLANGSFDENDAVSSSAPFVTVTLPDPVVSFDGTNTTFTYINDGSWPKGDLVIGGSNPIHNIRFRAVPGCMVPTGSPFNLRMEADMIRYLNAPVSLRDTITSVSTNTNKTILQPTATLLPASPQEFIPNTDTVSWEIDINNTTSYGNADKLIQHAWLSIESSPLVSIFAIEEITLPGPAVPFPINNYSDGSNYWIQVGELDAFSTRRFRISGVYEGCERQELNALLGYSCANFPNPDPGSGYLLAGTSYECPTVTLPLAIQPSPVSLSLEIEGPPLPAPLCEELDYSVTISNLQLPTAYNNQITTSLPFGAEVVSGSSQIEIPANSGNWQALNDPTDQGNNQMRWELSTDPNGLTQLRGVNHAPENTYRLSFKLLTRCGLNAGLRIGFQAEATNSCDEPESRTAFSERLLIEGLPAITNAYALFLDTDNGSFQACDTSTISGKVINLGPLPTSDLEYALISIPSAFSSLPSTLTGPTSITDVQLTPDRQLIQLQMPTGVPVGDSIAFAFQVEDNRQEELLCETVDISIAAVVESQVVCTLSASDSCNILYVLNTDTILVDISKDDLELELIEHTSISNNNDGETLQSRLRLHNLRSLPANTDTIIWEVYLDMDNNGSIDYGNDPILYSSDERPLSIAPNGTWEDDINFNIPTNQVCQLLLTYRNTGYNCQCDLPEVIPLPVPLLQNAGPDAFICSGDSTWLGTDERTANISYEWLEITTDALNTVSPTDSAFTQFTAENDGFNNEIYTFALETNRANLCISQDTISVTVYPALRPEVTVISDYNGQDISCTGVSDGTLSVNAVLATAPVLFQLEGSLPSNNPVFDSLAAGNYSFDIIDANGCRASVAGELTDPPPIELELQTTDVNCYGGSDGTISLSVAGGTPGYNYSWSATGENSPEIGDLNASVYLVSITDSNDCLLISDSIYIAQATPIVYDITIDSTRCSYSNDGLATITSIMGGQGPYFMNWEDGSSGMSNSNLSLGSTLLEITDNAGCLVDSLLYIPGPLPLDINTTQQENVSCNGFSDGSISITVTGGHAPYAYVWNNNETSNNVPNLQSGNYTVTITDANNCVLQSPEYIITQPAPLDVALLNLEDASCFGYADGSITIQAAGGTTPFNYQWSNGQVQATIDNLLAGNYTVDILDANDCPLETTYTINQPSPLSSTYDRIEPACFGDDGFFIFAPSGGTPGYQFSTDGGQSFSSAVQQQVVPGTYDLVVTDANNCFFNLEAEMIEPLPILIDAPEQIVLNYGDTLAMETYAYNIRGDSIIRWLPFDEQLSCHDCLDPVLIAQQTTVYTLQVGDSFNCVEEVRIPVIVERPRRLFLPNAFSPDGLGDNEIFYPFGAREVAQILRFEVYNRWGNLVFREESFPANDPSYGWDGTFNGEQLPSTVYVYQIAVLYTDGTIIHSGGDVMLMR